VVSVPGIKIALTSHLRLSELLMPAIGAIVVSRDCVAASATSTASAFKCTTHSHAYLDSATTTSSDSYVPLGVSRAKAVQNGRLSGSVSL
jgi:hypothetical protein